MTALRDALANPATPSISFEFFPPKTDEGEAKLWETIRALQSLAPTFVSVTYGAGGSSRDRTVEITARIQAETSMTAMAHLTCVNATADEVLGVVDDLNQSGVRAIMALRGDPPGGFGAPWVSTPGGFEHASDLIAALRAQEDPANPYTIGVAAFPEGHPEATDLDDSAKWLTHKLEMADFAVTQMFFDLAQYQDLVHRVQANGCTKPVIPGIMPPASGAQIARMVSMSGGAIPQNLIDTLDAYPNPEDQAKAGVDWAITFAQSLLDVGAPGLHFYTLNKRSASRDVVEALALDRS